MGKFSFYFDQSEDITPIYDTNPFQCLMNTILNIESLNHKDLKKPLFEKLDETNWPVVHSTDTLVRIK